MNAANKNFVARRRIAIQRVLPPVGSEKRIDTRCRLPGIRFPCADHARPAEEKKTYPLHHGASTFLHPANIQPSRAFPCPQLRKSSRFVSAARYTATIVIAE